MSEIETSPTPSYQFHFIIRRDTPEGLIRVGDVELDWRSHHVMRASRFVAMTTLQVRLLRTLMLAPGQVLSRAEIVEATWPRGVFIGERTVDVHIAALRKALCTRGDPDIIRTVRGRGYALVRRSATS